GLKNLAQGLFWVFCLMPQAVPLGQIHSSCRGFDGSFRSCMLHRFVYGGSRVICRSAAKPRFGRSLSLLALRNFISFNFAEEVFTLSSKSRNLTKKKMRVRKALLEGPIGFGAAPLGNMFR